MKKILAAVIAAALALALTACASSSSSETAVSSETPVLQGAEVNLGLLKGPTGIGAVYLMDEECENTYNTTLFSSPTDITAKIISGELDIAAVPANLAAVLYAKTEGKIQILALNTFSTLYVVASGDEKIESVDDLKGKTILLSGQGSTPEYVLDYILTANGIKDDVTVEFASEHAEVVTALAEGTADIVVLPEPNVTTAIMKTDGAYVALSLGDLWAEAADGNELTMGCVVVNREFAEANPDAVEIFCEEYAASIEKVNADAAKAGELCETYDIVPNAKVAENAIPRCAIRYVAGDEMKTTTENFLSVLYSYNPSAVGGAMPSDDFYYGISE